MDHTGGNEKNAIAGFVCGIVALVAFGSGIPALICAIVGLPLSISGRNSSQRKMAIAGIVCSSVALGLAILAIAFAAAIIAFFKPLIDQVSAH